MPAALGTEASHQVSAPHPGAPARPAAESLLPALPLGSWGRAPSCEATTRAKHPDSPATKRERVSGAPPYPNRTPHLPHLPQPPCASKLAADLHTLLRASVPCPSTKYRREWTLTRSEDPSANQLLEVAAHSQSSISASCITKQLKQHVSREARSAISAELKKRGYPASGPVQACLIPTS